MLRLLALSLPLGLDTFAVAAALGVAGGAGRRRVRLGLLFAAFEGGMPLAGLLAGAALGGSLGAAADYLAVAALLGVGAWMLLSGEGAEEARLQALLRARRAAVLGLGLSVSLDELAIGFALGLARVPLVAAIVLFAAQAFLVSQLGFALGRRVGERVREGAERAAGGVLIALALLLLVSKLSGLPF